MKLRHLALLLPAIALAHVGSPDIFVEGAAGPYRLFVTVRPPLTIPGVAELEVRSESSGIREIRAVPLTINGPGAKFAPVPDLLKSAGGDPQFFTGSLWMMASGSWQVRITVDGAQGQGVMAVPVPSVARASKGMQFGLGAGLAILGLFLVGGMAAIVGAGVREAALDAGAQLSPQNRMRGRMATAVATAALLLVVWGGNAWWKSEASDYDTRIYKPLNLSATLDSGALTLRMSEPGWMQDRPGLPFVRAFTRKVDDLIPDHGHLMHLYAIRQPGLDVVYHLHPTSQEPGVFQETLPSTEAGHYRLYADIVHANGFAETLVSEVDLPALQGRPLGEDEATGWAKPWGDSTAGSTVFELPDGYKMEWLREKSPIRAAVPSIFRFRLTRRDGSEPSDMALYMGMLGHAAFVKTDGTVFAHIHPNGSASMAAMMLADPQTKSSNPEDHGSMNPGMHMEHETAVLPNIVGFPFGVPSPGRYRVFVQMKHGETVETGIFDVAADK